MDGNSLCGSEGIDFLVSRRPGAKVAFVLSALLPSQSTGVRAPVIQPAAPQFKIKEVRAYTEELANGRVTKESSGNAGLVDQSELLGSQLEQGQGEWCRSLSLAVTSENLWQASGPSCC